MTGVQRRVVLRPPRAADARELLALVRASRALHRPWVEPPSTPAQFRAYLERGREREFVPLLACRKEDGRIVGALNLSQIFLGNFQSAYLGYWVGALYAGQGLMTEALALALRHAFGRLRLHRVEANIQPGNTRSIALVKRSGFRREGFSPRYLKIAGRWRDHERWALTADEKRGQGKGGQAIFRRSDPPGIPSEK